MVEGSCDDRPGELSEDLGGLPLDPRIRATFRERVALIKGAFKSCVERDPDMADADESFAILRALNFLAVHKERYEKHRDKLGPNIIANYEQGLGMSAADAARDAFCMLGERLPVSQLNRQAPDEEAGRRVLRYRTHTRNRTWLL